MADETGARILIRTIPRGGERDIQLENGVVDSWRSRLAWSAAADALYVSADKDGRLGIVRVDLKDGSVSSLDVQIETFSLFSTSPDGRRLAYEYRTGDSNVWLLENF